MSELLEQEGVAAVHGSALATQNPAKWLPQTDLSSANAL